MPARAFFFPKMNTLRSWQFWLLVAVVVCIALLYAVDPAQSAAAPKCLIKQATGYSCPGCGLQRAAHALLHGHVWQAIQFNFFFLLAVPYILALVVSDLILKGERQRRWQRITHNRWLVIGYVVAYFAWWIVRNVLNI